MAEARQIPRNFKEPNAIDRIINRAFGILLKFGIGLSHNYLEVRGRKTGRPYATPVNVLEYEGRKYLVAPRGYTQWVRIAEASGEVTLVRGAKRARMKLSAVPDAAKAELFKSISIVSSRLCSAIFRLPPGRLRKHLSRWQPDTLFLSWRDTNRASMGFAGPLRRAVFQ
jgi:deazaflavin-dependent oxidoreductase (nitroreductase family)